MEKKEVIDAIARDLTSREEELIKEHILSERVKGSTKGTKALAEELSSSFPVVTETAIKRLERDPNFGQQLFKEHKTKTNHRVGAVWNTLVNMAEEGDIKAIRLYFELTKDLNKEGNTTKTGIQNVIQLSSLPAEQLDQQFLDYDKSV